jgi:glycogen synthase
MNILFICDEYPPGRHGGIGTVVQLTARALVSQGHNVVVAGFYDWAYG